MGDKGFTIQDLLEPLDVTLNIAPSVGSLGQHSPAEAIATEEIASEIGAGSGGDDDDDADDER